MLQASSIQMDDMKASQTDCTILDDWEVEGDEGEDLSGLGGGGVGFVGG